MFDIISGDEKYLGIYCDDNRVITNGVCIQIVSGHPGATELEILRKLFDDDELYLCNPLL